MNIIYYLTEKWLVEFGDVNQLRAKGLKIHLLSAEVVSGEHQLCVESLLSMHQLNVVDLTAAVSFP